MLSNNIDIHRPQPESSPSLPRAFLEYQNIAELKALVPLKEQNPKNVEVIRGEELSRVIQDLETEPDPSGLISDSQTGNTHRPYANAEITVEKNTSFSDKKLTQTYLLEHRLNNLTYLAMLAREFGVDMFHLDGVTTLKDDQGQIIAKISPPVFEVNSQGEYKLVAGHQRYFLAYLLGEDDINIITIRNFDPDHARPYEPVDFNDVKILNSPPPVDRRRTLMAGHSEYDFVDFTALGEDGKRRSRLELGKPYFPEDPTKGTSKAITKQVNAKLHHLGAGGFFPSAINHSSEGLSRIPEVRDAIPIDDNFFLADIDIEWLNQNKVELISHYQLITETKRRSKTPASLVVLTKDKLVFSENPASLIADGEISISEQIRAQINDYLGENALSPIASTDNSSLHPNAPQVEGFRFIDSNKKFFQILVVDYTENGEKHSRGYMFNRRETIDGQISEGVAMIPKTVDGKYILVNRYREVFGLISPETSRCFSAKDYKEKFLNESGISNDPDNIVTTNIGQLIETHDFEAGANELVVLQLTEPVTHTSEHTPKSLDGSLEYAKSVEYSNEEMHQLLASGRISCELTAATITLEQLHTGKLILNPELSNPDLNLRLEEYYSAADSKYYLRPPRTKEHTGVRQGMNKFPNSGCALIWGLTEYSDNQQDLPSGKKYRDIPVSDVVELIRAGALDSSAISHICQVLRHQGVLVLSPPSPPLSPQN